MKITIIHRWYFVWLKEISLFMLYFFLIWQLSICVCYCRTWKLILEWKRHCCHVFSLNNFIYMTFTYIHIHVYTHIHIYNKYIYTYKVTIHKIFFILTWVHVFMLYYIRQSMLIWSDGLSWCFQVFSKYKLISHID